MAIKEKLKPNDYNRKIYKIDYVHFYNMSCQSSWMDKS